MTKSQTVLMGSKKEISPISLSCKLKAIVASTKVLKHHSCHRCDESCVRFVRSSKVYFIVLKRLTLSIVFSVCSIIVNLFFIDYGSTCTVMKINPAFS